MSEDLKIEAQKRFGLIDRSLLVEVRAYAGDDLIISFMRRSDHWGIGYEVPTPVIPRGQTTTSFLGREMTLPEIVSVLSEAKLAAAKALLEEEPIE